MTRSLMQKDRTIAFRLDPDVYAQLIPFKNTFPDQQWGEAMRWLMEQPETQELIKGRCRAAIRPSRRTP